MFNGPTHMIQMVKPQASTDSLLHELQLQQKHAIHTISRDQKTKIYTTLTKIRYRTTVRHRKQMLLFQTMLWTEIPVAAQPAQLIHATNTWLILITTAAVRDERSPWGRIKIKRSMTMLHCSLTLSSIATHQKNENKKDIHTATNVTQRTKK